MRIREQLKDAHREAINAVGGRESVRRALSQRDCSGLTHVVGIGKASAHMVAGALDALGDTVSQALVITKHGHTDGLEPYSSRVRCLQSAHPVPDQSCLDAGEALWQLVVAAPRDAGFVFLISGGASALVERLPAKLDIDFLARVNAWLLAGGYPIGVMNRVRKRLSTIKGGRLAHAVAGRRTLCLMISDVPDDDPKVIGSGLLIAHRVEDIAVDDVPAPDWLAQAIAAPPPLAAARDFQCIEAALVATPALARESAAEHLSACELTVRVHPRLLEGDVMDAAIHVVATAAHDPGVVHIWGSETTVTLPPRPGRGGRCQSLALASACELVAVGRRGEVLAAGTDGSDGPGEDAGAVIDELTLHRGYPLDAAQALAHADAGTFLAASGDLIRTGPTGTNVMDLLMARVAVEGEAV